MPKIQSGKENVAVIFGTASPEHDVSIVTGLQALKSIDPDRYNPFPVYIDIHNQWWIGDALHDRSTYLPGPNDYDQLTKVRFDLETGQLIGAKQGLFGGPKAYDIDIALIACHGRLGEDGSLQGLFELTDIPYTGMRRAAAAVSMDKDVTKRLLSAHGIPVLSGTVIHRPKNGYLLDADALAEQTANITFPALVKPRTLGSSIGVARVENANELNAVLPTVFKYDTAVLVEPFVENLVEYNIAVRRDLDDPRGIVPSVIEMPKRVDELLDFKQKYMSGGDDKSGDSGGQKQPGQLSEGMLSLTRDIDPDMDPVVAQKITDWAVAAFMAVGGTGAPRIDFLSNEETGDIWLNEINSTPGSFGFYLWEASSPQYLFTELLTHLIEEAKYHHKRIQLPKDPVPEDARLFGR
jgi:D-alanine-D-alanine ligase